MQGLCGIGGVTLANPSFPCLPFILFSPIFLFFLQAAERGAEPLAAGGRCKPCSFQDTQRLFNQYLAVLWQASGFPAAATADDTPK